MKKIILLSFISLISFVFESVAMEEKEISTKRKLSIACEQDQGGEESISANFPTKKPKLIRDFLNGAVIPILSTAYQDGSEDDIQEIEEETKETLPLTTKVDSPVFKIPDPIPKRFIKKGNAYHSPLRSQKNVPLLKNKKTTFKQKSNPPLTPVRLTPVNSQESARRINDVISKSNYNNKNTFKIGDNNSSRPRLLSTRGTTFHFPPGSTWKDIINKKY